MTKLQSVLLWASSFKPRWVPLFICQKMHMVIIVLQTTTMQKINIKFIVNGQWANVAIID